MLRNDAMSDIISKLSLVNSLALVALSSPNVRISNDEPEPRMLCKCKRGCNKESRHGSIFCAIAHGLVQSALLNHGQLIGTLHHLASVTTLIAAMVLLDSFALGIVYKQTSQKSVPLSADLFKVCVPEVHLSVHTLYFLTVSSELLRGLSSVLLV